MTMDTSKIPATRLCMDDTPTSGSGNLITSGAVAQALANASKQAAERAVADADGNVKTIVPNLDDESENGRDGVSEVIKVLDFSGLLEEVPDKC